MRQRITIFSIVAVCCIALPLVLSCDRQPPPPVLPKGTDCSAFVVACYDEFARQPANLICFRPTSRWDRTTLTWRLANLLPDLDADGQREAAQRAFDTWAAVSNLVFMAVDADDENADISIEFVADDHGDPFPFPRPTTGSNILGHAYFPGSPRPGDIHLRAGAPWSLSPEPGQFDLYTVILHELGHALGLEHSLAEEAVMGPSYKADGSVTLSDADIEAIQALYGSQGDGIPPLPVRLPQNFCEPENLLALGDPDSDGDGIPDTIEVFVLGTDPFNPDSSGDGISDFEAVFILGIDPLSPINDCNGSGFDDAEDIAEGRSQDCNGNGIPDECELALGFATDCNNSGILDECDIASGFSLDCNNNGIPDDCDIALRFSGDCNNNSIPDECDIASGFSTDVNGNGIPDECEEDLCEGVECDDGIFCNGLETCVAGVCIEGDPPCGAGFTCSESQRRCIATGPVCDTANPPDECDPIFVDRMAIDGMSTGRDWLNAYIDLQDALAEANQRITSIPNIERVEIWVANGVYTPSSADPPDPTATFALRNKVRLFGGFGGLSKGGLETSLAERDPLRNPTHLSGNNALGTMDETRPRQSPGKGEGHAYHVITAIGSNSTAVLDGFIVGGGRALNPDNADDRVGGGMYIRNASPTIANVMFAENYADEHGGGVYVHSGSPTFINCIFVNNVAGFSFEFEDIRGGGIAIRSGATIIVNNTFTLNSASHGGGAVAVLSDQPTTNPVRILNSILWDNSAEIIEIQEENQLRGVPGALELHHSCVEGLSGMFGGVGNISDNPLFDFIQPCFGSPDQSCAEGLRLSPSSPCIDSGDNSVVPTDAYDVDRDGVFTERFPLDYFLTPRFVDDPSTTDCPQPGANCGTPPIIDMGAIEFVPPAD